MPQDLTPHDVLDATNAARIVDFARACRAAARAVSLYPAEHPAIEATLSRLVEACGRGQGEAWQVGVAPGALLLEGRRVPRPDAAVTELADLLHAHHVGALVLHGAPDRELWLKFLRLVATAPGELVRQGGLARLWTTAGGRELEVREVDYASVLRERAGGDAATWDQIVRNCLQGDRVSLDEQALAVLTEIAGDADRLAALAQRLEQGRSEGALRSPAAALLAMLQAVLARLATDSPEHVSPVLENVAVAACRFSPDLIAEILATSAQDRAATEVDVRGELLARFTDNRISSFVAHAVTVSHGATGRLAAAFFALVPEPDRRGPLLDIARAQAATLAAENGQEFERVWQGVEQLLGTYRDEAYVSQEYATDLATARVRSGELDLIVDDPPERLAAWRSTVSDVAIRALDLQMLLDLLIAETDPVRWREVAELVVSHVEDLLLVGDFAAASKLVEGLRASGDEPESAGSTEVPSRANTASAVLERLVSAQHLGQVVNHLQSIPDDDFAHVKSICLSLGEGVIGPLAELLATQERALTRQRLTDLLLAFGPLGRRYAEQLKNSSNSSVRRVAIYLLREFGGSEALPDLASLLDDAEPHVQRDAVRAILQIGSDEAYSVLDRALRSGTGRSREAILRLLDMAGDERAAPLFAYIVRRGDYKKGLLAVYLKAVAALGRHGSEGAVEALKEGLYRGEWWTPRRTAALRDAAAASLQQIGTAQALEALQEAAERGPRGVRLAARAHLVTRR